MNQYTYSDTDNLKEISEQLAEDLKSNFTIICPDQSDFSKTQELMDKLSELCELHERNNLNICLCGGLSTVI